LDWRLGIAAGFGHFQPSCTIVIESSLSPNSFLLTADSSMKKNGIFVLFLPAAMLVAGLFGIIHDEISYSVSNEYFQNSNLSSSGCSTRISPTAFARAKLAFWHRGGWEYRSVFSAAWLVSFSARDLSCDMH
jgi:hypothetical protein